VNLVGPALLDTTHYLDAFQSGVDTLDYWLRHRARKNQASGASRTYVVCDASRVLAYYCLASGSLSSEQSSSSRFSRNMPNPIPVVILGRLAVDRSLHGKGIGRGLVRDACLRVLQAADILGIRGIVVHALSLEAKFFYEKMGFDAAKNDPMMLMITLNDLRSL
jgi:GNAT superfamily N-acetyltransferase